MAGVESLQKVECFAASDLAHKNAIGSVAKRRPQKIRDRDWWERLLVPKRHLRATRFKPNQIWLVEVNLGSLLDHNDAVARRNERSQSIPARRLACSCASGDQDVLLGCDRVGELRRQGAREHLELNQIIQAIPPGELP